MTDKNNQNYIHLNNYKRVKGAGKWAMGIAIFNVLGFFILVLFINFDASIFDILFEFVMNAIVFFLGYRIYIMEYIKTGTYLKIIMGIIIFSIAVRVIYGLSAGISNIIMFFIILFGLNAFSELKKDINFSKSLSK